MMTEAQQKAWDCLTEKEKQSLFLRVSQGKSTWETGEIMKLSHYKYIEIRDRSEKFFRLFSDFFELHPSIFRPDCPCERNFQDYIEGCIEKRLTRKQSTQQCGDSTQLLSKVNSQNMIRNMKRLQDSDDPWDIDTRKLILEFDRWNNARILPGIIQQPSAFKRRSNKKDKIYIRYLLNKIPDWMLEVIIERFRYKSKPNIKGYYIGLISDKWEDGYYILKVRPTQEVVDELSKFYLYIFDNRDDADTFAFMVSRYAIKTSKVKTGQKFWPEFRRVVEQAVNYKQVNNIDFTVKNLDYAYNTHIPRRKKDKSKTSS
nr:MAG TPA: hypothetical protein [Caudoviricetes sp.]